MNKSNKRKKMKSSGTQPTEVKPSFVQSVTSKVSGLLSTTIERWFGSPNSSNANASTPSEDVTDSSSDEETVENTVYQPPAKRMKYYGSPGNYDKYTVTETTETKTGSESIGSSQFSLRSRLVANSPVPKPQYVPPSQRADDEISVEGSDVDSSEFSSRQSTSVWCSKQIKRKSIFGSNHTAESSKMAQEKASTPSSDNYGLGHPYHKPSMLGSPFYPGRTNYGGASVSYINRPNITQTRSPRVYASNTNEESTMSSSSRRILDLIEQYASPLAEARSMQSYMDSMSAIDSSIVPYSKVASYKTRELYVPSLASTLRLKKKSRLMDTTNAARQIIASYSSTTNYQPANEKTSKTDTEVESVKQTTKIKTHITRANRGDNLLETLPPVNLPETTLAIHADNLPKFSFGPSMASSTPRPTYMNKTSHIKETKTNLNLIQNERNDSIDETFKFSSPDRVPTEGPLSYFNTPQFTFVNPDRNIDERKVEENKPDPEVKTVTEENDTDPEKTQTIKAKVEGWQCADCWVNNKDDAVKCVCCGGKPPVNKTANDPSESHTMKKPESLPLDTSSASQLTSNTPSKPPSTDTKGWKCDECWISNDMSAEKCVCCGAVAPGKAPSKSITSSWGTWEPTPSTSYEAYESEDTEDTDWKCKACCIYNKEDEEYCIACESIKPVRIKSTAPAVPRSTPSLFGTQATQNNSGTFNEIIKTQSDKWTCSTCLVQNENDATTCACCESNRPDAPKLNKSFNFGKSATTFKFGIDWNATTISQPTLPTQSAVQLSQSNSIFEVKPKVEQTETNNNNIPPFTFTSPNKKAADQVDNFKQTTGESSKFNFTFGIPLPAIERPKVLLTPAKITSEDKEKPQEVPKINFGVPAAQVEPKPFNAGFFSPPQAMQTLPTVASVAPAISVPSIQLNETVTNPSNILSSQSITIPASTTATAAAPLQNTFSFSATGPRMADNFFASPLTSNQASAVATVPANVPAIMSFGQMIQATPGQPSAAPVSSPMSIFQNSAATPATSALVFQMPSTSSTPSSLFKQTEPSTTAAPLALAPPIFSFGSNTTTPAPVPALNPIQQSKPKFNFTFGSANKQEEQSMFKTGSTSMFGAPTENVPPTNNFMFSSGLGAGSTLGGGGGNGISSENTMSCNGVSIDTPVNTLNGGNDMQTGNSMPSNTNIFGVSAPEESMWGSSSNTSGNVFSSNMPINTMPKPAAFTFGSSTPFNASSTPAAFRADPQPMQNVFGMSSLNNNNNAQSMFSTPVQNAPVANVFGNPPAQPMGMFGASSIATPTFGALSSSIPSFESPSLTPAPAPAFNFGSAQSTNVFGFGQQQQQQQQQQLQQQQQQQLQQQQQAPKYTFGNAGGAPPMLFNMGSAPNTTVRRVKKAVRRNTPR